MIVIMQDFRIVEFTGFIAVLSIYIYKKFNEAINS